MRVLSFGEILLRHASPGYTKLFQKDSLDATFCEGDSFTAEVIYGLANGKSNLDTVEFATATSCLKHTIESDYNRTTVEDVENLIDNGRNGRIRR